MPSCTGCWMAWLLSDRVALFPVFLITNSCPELLGRATALFRLLSASKYPIFFLQSWAFQIQLLLRVFQAFITLSFDCGNVSVKEWRFRPNGFVGSSKVRQHFRGLDTLLCRCHIWLYPIEPIYYPSKAQVHLGSYTMVSLHPLINFKKKGPKPLGMSSDIFKLKQFGGEALPWY